MAEIEIRGETINLLPEKAIFWPKTSSLFIADLHLGKTRHFRKEGIGVPDSMAAEDYVKLNNVLSKYSPKEVYLLGDLFHSEYNAEWSQVIDFVQSKEGITFHLIIGNHDILDEAHYRDAGFVVHRDYLDLPPFKLIHEPPEEQEGRLEDEGFILCGHIHPGVRIMGRGRQHFRLPCYFFKKNYAILPAFGTFTGVKTLKVMDDGIAYAIVKDRIVQITNSSMLN